MRVSSFVKVAFGLLVAFAGLFLMVASGDFVDLSFTHRMAIGMCAGVALSASTTHIFG